MEEDRWPKGATWLKALCIYQAFGKYSFTLKLYHNAKQILRSGIKNSILGKLGSHYLKFNKPIVRVSGVPEVLWQVPTLCRFGATIRHSQFIGTILVGTSKFMAGSP